MLLTRLSSLVYFDNIFDSVSAHWADLMLSLLLENLAARLTHALMAAGIEDSILLGNKTNGTIIIIQVLINLKDFEHQFLPN